MRLCAMKWDLLNAASGLFGLAAIGSGFGVAFGLLTGAAKLAFWAPLAMFVALLLIGMAIDHRAKR